MDCSLQEFVSLHIFNGVKSKMLTAVLGPRFGKQIHRDQLLLFAS